MHSFRSLSSDEERGGGGHDVVLGGAIKNVDTAVVGVGLGLRVAVDEGSEFLVVVAERLSALAGLGDQKVAEVSAELELLVVMGEEVEFRHGTD